MLPPLVSAVIPTHNYARYVADAVRSAIEQTYPNMEVIVVDDGSDDNTREVLEPYRDRIRYVYQENAGVCMARNRGILEANGRFVAFLDSDDFWAPGKTERQMADLADSDAVGSCTGMALVDDRGNRLPKVHVPNLPDEDQIGRLCVRTHFSPSSVIARKSFLIRAGMFDGTLTSVEDRDMWIRLCPFGRWLAVCEPLTFYRVHGTGMSWNTTRMKLNHEKVLWKSFTQLPELAKRRMLRRKAYGFMHYDVARSWFYESSRRWPAILEMLRSFAVYPFPFDPQTVSAARMPRLKNLLTFLVKKPGHTYVHDTGGETTQAWPAQS